MAQCKLCKKNSPLISSALKYCVDCIRNEFPKIKDEIFAFHFQTRKEFNLPESPPSTVVVRYGGRSPSKTNDGIKCPLCVNQCIISNGKTGYCGVQHNRNGKFSKLTKDFAYLDWYYDNLPTNCVADWVCAGGTGVGYPQYAYKPGPEYGYKNLAVFFRACNFNCLFCQNWHFKVEPRRRVSIKELISGVDDKTSCICFFGGDPAPNILYALSVSEQILHQVKRPFRICWETNGSMMPSLVNKMIEVSLPSGGCIKIDLKTFTEELNYALCGVSNKQTLANIRRIAKDISKRPQPPLLVLSTLLVPGYIDETELKKIGQFIADIDKNIPWALLAFYPCFYFSDLPRTSKKQAETALAIAKEIGLTNVRIGNIHLLT